MAFCKSCGKPFEWWRTEAGKSMPIDPEPTTDGNVMIDVVKNVVRVVPAGSHVPLYRSHFATCPAADSHRSRR